MKLSEIKKRFSDREGIIHLLLWALYFSAINVSWTADWFDPSLRPNTPAPLSVLAFPAFFYLNAYWLIPCFFSGNNWYRYFLAAALAAILPELLRAALFVAFSPSTGLWGEMMASELMSRDSLLTASPSPFWYGFLLSSAYKITKDRIVNSRKLEQLEQEKTTQALQLLRSQIDPHFLFNNLNTLDDLIERDPKLARSYLHKLSSLYRYTLSSADRDVVSLQEEWRLMEAYIYLLEVRFGKAYQFEVAKLPANPDPYVIPPAALQHLIENVVKHNRGDVAQPLLTTITVEDKGICIRHPRRPKAGKTDSPGTGLKNIQARYRLLSDSAIHIQADEYFTVILPLLPKLS